MKKAITIRLKEFLMNVMKHEGDVQAWEQYVKLEPDCDELDAVIMHTPFAREAWEEMKKRNAPLDDLLPVIERAPDPFIQKEAEALVLERFKVNAEALERMVIATQSDTAARLLLNSDPDAGQLQTILCYSDFSDEAAKELLKGELSNEELIDILKHSTLKTEAWNRLIAQSPTTEEIIQVIQSTDVDEQAWAYLIEQNPSNKDLDDLINDYGESRKKREEAADYILNNTPSVSDLIDLISEEIRLTDAWEMMRQMTPDEQELSSVVWRLVRLESSMKNEVAAWCLKFNPSTKDLWYILEFSDQKDEAALQLLHTPLELYELADIVVHSTAAPVLKHVCERVQFDIPAVHEEELIRQIADKILRDPDVLDVNHWHNDNRHCIGGWAIQLNKEAQEIEKMYGSEIAACLLLPNYKHLFFTGKEAVIRELKEIVLQ
jgi:hypothetical protein